MNKNKRKCHEEWVDIAKGVAMLAIMYSHIRTDTGGGLQKYQLYKYLEVPFISVFFFLSGFLCHPNIEINNWKYEAGKRLKRLLVPYFGYSMLLYCLYVIWNRTSLIVVGDYIWPLFGIVYSRAGLFYPYYASGQKYFLLCWNGAFWFITAMAVSTLLYFLYLAKCNTNKKKALYIIACFLISCLLRNIPILLPWSIDTSFCLVIFMIFGMHISRCNIINILKQKHTVEWLLLAAVYIILANDAGDINMSIRQYGSYGATSVLLYIILGLLGSLLYSKISICMQGTIMGRVLAIIGTHTLSMLGLQFFIFYFCDYVVGYYNLQIIQTHVFAYAIMKMVLAVGLSITFDKLITKLSHVTRRFA